MTAPKYILFFILPVMLVGSISAQSSAERRFVREGNKLYEARKYNEAEIRYRKALQEKESSLRAKFNLGDAQYKQGRFSEAANTFTDLSGDKTNRQIQAKSYYNLGNALFNDKKIQESIEAYKKSLLLNPSDMEAKHNLMIAQRMLQRSQQQQQQNQNGNQQQQQNQQKQEEQKNQQNQNQQDKQQQQQSQPRNEISRQDAERILQALMNNEKQTREKLNRQQAAAKPKTIDKNW
ncbi:MAG: tetratricopeptide repeat protein [Bacteroidales bacterium]